MAVFEPVWVLDGSIWHPDELFGNGVISPRAKAAAVRSETLAFLTAEP